VCVLNECIPNCADERAEWRAGPACRPLAEGAVLKKKFDDIFAATKYTKALEAIRKIKLEQAQGIKARHRRHVKPMSPSQLDSEQEKKLMLENLKTHKDNAHKLETDLATAEAARADLFNRLSALHKEETQQTGNLTALRAQLEELSHLLSAIQVLKAKRDTTVAETAKRQSALLREVQNTSLEQLQSMAVSISPCSFTCTLNSRCDSQENFEGKKREMQHKKTDVERRLSDARIASAHLRDVCSRELSKQVSNTH